MSKAIPLADLKKLMKDVSSQFFFDNMVVQPTIRDQIEAMCKGTTEPMPFGFEIRTSEFIPKNGYVLQRGGKVVAVGVFDADLSGQKD